MKNKINRVYYLQLWQVAVQGFLNFLFFLSVNKDGLEEGSIYLLEIRFSDVGINLMILNTGYML